jgi:hypothetical protein
MVRCCRPGPRSRRHRSSTSLRSSRGAANTCCVSCIQIAVDRQHKDRGLLMDEAEGLLRSLYSDGVRDCRRLLLTVYDSLRKQGSVRSLFSGRWSSTAGLSALCSLDVTAYTCPRVRMRSGSGWASSAMSRPPPAAQGAMVGSNPAALRRNELGSLHARRVVAPLRPVESTRGRGCTGRVREVKLGASSRRSAPIRGVGRPRSAPESATKPLLASCLAGDVSGVDPPQPSRQGGAQAVRQKREWGGELVGPPPHGDGEGGNR